MNFSPIKKIDRKEWLKLLHVREECPDWERLSLIDGSPAQQLVRQMDAAEKQLLDAVRPRGIYRVVERSQIHAEGVSIAKHLEGCDQVAALAVTSGSEIDDLIRRAQIGNIAQAVVLDTGASVLAEQIADAAEETIRREILGQDDGCQDDGCQDGAGCGSSPSEQLWMTSRFSPGYGDLPLSYQRDLLTLTDAPRKIGLMLTSGNIMVPRKSITALIGLADHPVTGRLASCNECVLRADCPFIKEGRHC